MKPLSSRHFYICEKKSTSFTLCILWTSKAILVFLFIFATSSTSHSQDLPGAVSSSDFQRYNQGIRLMFYNVENLFDIEHDSLKNDYDFLPEGGYNWSKKRLYTKIQNLSKVIMAAGGWEAPEIIGLCEVENRNVLTMLIRQSPLQRFPYRILHYESPDRRGIDVAMLYRADKFSVLKSSPIPLIFEGDSTGRTRDILYVKGLLMHRDTIHLFVNHWPSRFGGRIATDPLRCQAGKRLRAFTDSILANSAEARIIMMGDFNDEPEDHSVNNCLGATTDTAQANTSVLVNLMGPLKKIGAGTHAYNDFTGWEYSLLDQFIITPNLLQSEASVSIRESRAWIFAPSFIVETTQDGAKRPKRTYIGRSYHGGYSDHYPIFLDLILR